MASKFLQSAAQNGHRLLASDELIGRLYAAHHTAHQQGVAPLVADLPSVERANLALFCYQRAHLREVGLAIAATCDQWSLVNAAGRAGDALFVNSRSIPVVARALPVGRRKISLAALTPASRPQPEIIYEEEVEEQAAETVEERVLVDA